MKAPICCTRAQNTASVATTFADIPESGQGEVADSPIAVPKVKSTNEMAAARAAPANTAPHSTKLAAPAGAAGPGPTVVILISLGLPQAEDAQNEHHYDNQADEINDAVHFTVSASGSRWSGSGAVFK